MKRGGATSRVALDTATAMLVITGIFFWFREPRLPHARIPTASSSVAVTLPVAAAPSAADAGAIVASNIFGSSRSAPAVRYTPPGAGGASADHTGPAMQDEMNLAPVTPPRVYGTMTGPNGATALIQADSAGASGRLYREGDRVGAFRIEKILASSVVLRGPSGRVELRVEQREDRHE